MNITPTTELEAVNVLLATIGEAPLNTLEGELHVDAIMAQNTLSAVLKEFQCQSWYFNTERNYPLMPNGEGFIMLPSNVANVDFSPFLNEVDVVVRGNRLYDKKNHTYVFGKKYEATVTFILPFFEIPQSAKNYVVIASARRFQTQTVGSATLDTFTEADEYKARSIFIAENVRTANLNMLSPCGNSTIGYNSVFSILRR